MAGYAASARLGRGAIRVDRPLGARSATGPAFASPTILGAPSVDEALEDVRVIRSWATIELHDRWQAICQTWTQTTFYVFHPESWR
ncbi:MAG: hypothetical protein M3P84_11680 [Chloroflexota bacterium]|nr:hypothetical protein [Chloroflexota bacterium]